MTISKRVLTKWRKEALKELQVASEIDRATFNGLSLKVLNNTINMYERILLLTQELIDQELLKEK